MESMPLTPEVKDLEHPEHNYISTACQHLLHDRCRDTCKFCAAPCQCPAPDCTHSTSPADADYELRQTIAVALHHHRGFAEGVAHPWEVAGTVINALRKINPINPINPAKPKDTK